MARRYFAKKKSKDPSLGNIIAVIVVLLLAAYGGISASAWFKENILYAKTRVEAPLLLDNARELLAANDLAAARTKVQSIIERVQDPAITPEALDLLADIEIASGDLVAALAALERAASEFPGSPSYPRLTTRRASLLEQLGRTAEAVPLYEEVRRSAPPELAADATLGLARIIAAEDAGGGDASLELYEETLRSAAWDSETWNAALDAIGGINVGRMFSRSETPDCKYYIIKQGDNLTDIGMALNTTQGSLIRANGIDDPSKIRLGQRLKYTPKDFRIIIERSTCRLFLLDKDGIFKRYSVGLGMPGHETTLGRYTIGNKEKDPVWHKPASKPIPAGDPRNELGTRWMPLMPTEEGLPNDLGIHGTIAPETVGKYISRGCPRLQPAEVEELYDLVVRSTQVEIVEEMNPADAG